MKYLHAGISAGFWFVGYRYPERLSAAAPDEGGESDFPCRTAFGRSVACGLILLKQR